MRYIGREKPFTAEELTEAARCPVVSGFLNALAANWLDVPCPPGVPGALAELGAADFRRFGAVGLLCTVASARRAVLAADFLVRWVLPFEVRLLAAGAPPERRRRPLDLETYARRLDRLAPSSVEEEEDPDRGDAIEDLRDLCVDLFGDSYRGDYRSYLTNQDLYFAAGRAWAADEAVNEIFWLSNERGSLERLSALQAVAAFEAGKQVGAALSTRTAVIEHFNGGAFGAHVDAFLDLLISSCLPDADVWPEGLAPDWKAHVGRLWAEAPEEPEPAPAAPAPKPRPPTRPRRPARSTKRTAGAR